MVWGCSLPGGADRALSVSPPVCDLGLQLVRHEGRALTSVLDDAR